MCFTHLEFSYLYFIFSRVIFMLFLTLSDLIVAQAVILHQHN